MNALYVFGCSCGAWSRPIKQVQNKINVRVYNTKRSAEDLKQHIKYLAQAGLEINGYPAIVVENGGKQITLLDVWLQSH